jgi:hypothetical protein
MTRMMGDIVKDSIAPYDDIDVVGEVPKGAAADQDRLIEAARTAKAEVILMSAAALEDTTDYISLLYQRPRLKILTISADGRYGFLYKLMPEVRPMGEVSPGGLVEAIRATCKGCRDSSHG